MRFKIRNPFDSHVHLLATGVFSRLGSAVTGVQGARAAPMGVTQAQGEGPLVFFGWNHLAEIRGYLEEWAHLPVPFMYSRKDGHQLWINPAVWQAFGFSDGESWRRYVYSLATEFSPLAAKKSIELLGSEKGELGAILSDPWGMWLWYELMKLYPERMRQDLLAAQEAFWCSGFSHVRDMSGSVEQWNVLRSLAQSSEWRLWVWQNFEYLGVGALQQLLDQVHTLRGEELDGLQLGGIKMYLDGTLGFHSAASSCCQVQASSGLLWPDQVVTQAIEKIWEAGLAVCFHTIGEEAVAQAIRCYQQVERRGLRGTMHLEHVPVVYRDQLAEVRHKSIVVHFQPSHWWGDGEILARMDPERLSALELFPLEAVVGHGLRCFFGSDSPVYSPSWDASWQGLSLVMDDPEQAIELIQTHHSYLLHGARDTELIVEWLSEESAFHALGLSHNQGQKGSKRGGRTWGYLRLVGAPHMVSKSKVQ